MNKEEYAFVMNYLYTAYRQEPSKQEIKVYYNELGGCTQERVFGAARMWVRKSPFFPKIADLIKLIKDEEITFSDVLRDINYVISVPTGRSWNKKDIHPISYQVLKELGGKQRIASMSEDEKQKQIRMRHKYVVKEKALGLAHDDKPQIGNRDGKTESMKMIINKGLKLDSQETKESSDMGEQTPSKIRIL